MPLTTTRVLGVNLPAGGGGYFRLAPYAVSRWAIERVNRVEKRPAIFYFHPWELDPDQPRVAGVPMQVAAAPLPEPRKTEARLAQLLRDFRWDRVDRTFELAFR